MKSIFLSNKQLKSYLKTLVSIAVTLLLLMCSLNINAQVLETSDIPEGVYKGVLIERAKGQKLRAKLHILVANGLITGIASYGSSIGSLFAIISRAKSPGRYGELLFSLVGDSTIEIKSIPLADAKVSGIAKLLKTNTITPNKFKGLYQGEEDSVGEILVNIAGDGSAIVVGPAVFIFVSLPFIGKVDSNGNGHFTATFEAKKYQASINSNPDDLLSLTLNFPNKKEPRIVVLEKTELEKLFEKPEPNPEIELPEEVE